MYAGLVAALTVATVPVASRAAQALAGDGSPSLAYDTPADGSDAGGSAAAAAVAASADDPYGDVPAPATGTRHTGVVTGGSLTNVKVTLTEYDDGSGMYEMTLEPGDGPGDSKVETYYQALWNNITWSAIRTATGSGDGATAAKVRRLSFKESGGRGVKALSLYYAFRCDKNSTDASWANLRYVDLSGIDWSALNNGGLQLLFGRSMWVRRVDGLNRIPAEAWKAANKSSGGLNAMFIESGPRVLDLSTLSSDADKTVAGGMSGSLFPAKLVLGTGVTGDNAAWFLDLDSIGKYWDGMYLIDQEHKDEQVTAGGSSGFTLPSDAITTDSGFWTYHDKKVASTGKPVTYLKFFRVAFYSNGGTWGDAYTKDGGEQMDSSVYHTRFQQAYNGEDDVLPNKMPQPPMDELSYGSRQFLGWFKTKNEADAAAKEVAKGARVQDQPGYIDLSQDYYDACSPWTWSGGGTGGSTPAGCRTFTRAYASWGDGQNIPVYDEAGASVATGYSGGALTGKASVSDFDPNKVDANNFTATNALTGEAVSVAVEGTANDWKLKVGNDAKGNAPLRVEVTPGGYDQASGMYTSATLKVTYPVAAQVVDARGAAVLDGSGNPTTLLLDPQATVTGGALTITGKGSTAAKATVVIPDAGSKRPVAAEVTARQNYDPAQGKLVEVGADSTEVLEGATLQVTYQANVSATLAVEGKVYDGTAVSFAPSFDQAGYAGTDTFTWYKKNASGAWEEMAAGEVPTDAGTYKVSYSSTPNDGTWSFTGTTYTNGDGDGKNEFTITKADVTCAATMDKTFAYGAGSVTLPAGYDQFRDGGYDAAPDADKGRHVSGGAVTYKWQSADGSGGYADIAGNAAPTQPGSYRLHVECAEGTNWNRGEADFAFEIVQEKAPVIEVTGPGAPTYDGKTPEVKWELTNKDESGAFNGKVEVIWKDKDGSVLKDPPTDAGDYKVEVKVNPGAGEKEPTISWGGQTLTKNPDGSYSATQEVTIAKAEATLTANSATLDYTGSPVSYVAKDHAELSAPAGLTLPQGMSLDKATVQWSSDGGKTWSGDAPTDEGTYKVKVSVAGDGKNWADVEAMAEVTVSRPAGAVSSA